MSNPNAAASAQEKTPSYAWIALVVSLLAAISIVYAWMWLPAITFPVFMFTYIPIVIVSLFHNPAWQPIHHSRSVDLHQICAGK